jgi:hypothetical protein
MALWSTQPLTEMSTRNIPGGKGLSVSEAETSPPSVIRLSKKCGGLDVSQSYGPPRSVTGISLPACFDLWLSYSSDTEVHFPLAAGSTFNVSD